MIAGIPPKTRHRTAVVAGLLLCLAPTAALAATCGGPFNPLSVSATGVNFGNYDPTSPSATTSEGTVVVACELSVDVLPSFTVSLSRGRANHHSAREMSAGYQHRLYYNLYTNATHTIIWADGSGDSETRSHDGLLVLSQVELTIYGLIPAEQFVPAGLYRDTIVVTVEY
jgi:spore coat protein U domain-containing protein, fimbrial subunit CupE1/2/3/6